MFGFLLPLLLLVAGLQSPAQSAEAWWSEGTRLYDADQYAAAAKAFSRLTELRPNNGAALAMLGLCEYQLGDFDSALLHIQKARQAGLPPEPSLRSVTGYHYGLLLLENGRFEDGQKALDDMVQAQSGSEELKVALGCAVLRFRPSRARNDEQAAELIRSAGEAEMLAAQHEEKRARQAYEEVAARFGSRSNVQYAYGRFLLAIQENERAVEAFKRELVNTPQHVLARLAIADTLRSSDPQASLPFAQAALKLAPQLPTAHYVLGMSLLDNRRPAEAIRELEAAKQELPDQARIYYALARAYSSVGRKAEAAQASRRFTELKAAEKNARP